MTDAVAGEPEKIALSGEFDFQMVTIVGATEETSQATMEKFDDAASKARLPKSDDPGPLPHYSYHAVQWRGDLKLALRDVSAKSELWDFVFSLGATLTDTGYGTNDAAALRRPLSAIGDASDPASRISTIFKITPKFGITPANFVVNHDDGVSFYETKEIHEDKDNDGWQEERTELQVLAGSFPALTGVRETKITGYTGGQLDIVYVAANGNPSVLEVFWTQA